MKVHIMTDLEAVAGVVSQVDYCIPPGPNKYGLTDTGRNYEQARQLITLEVNAAIEGLIQGGATDIFVCDGHGFGSIDVSRIHRAARVLTGTGMAYPMGLDDSFDATIMIGQHAMGNTDGGHLCHSGSFSREQWRLNGQLIGEIHLWALLAQYFNVPLVMISGDKAGCAEAKSLIPSIHTVEVIEGVKRGSTADMTAHEALTWNVPAIHVAPARSREMIRDAAGQCLAERDSVERYWIEPPYEVVRVQRRTEDQPGKRSVNHGNDLIEVLTQQARYESVVQ